MQQKLLLCVMEPFLQRRYPAYAWVVLSSKSSHLLLMQHDYLLLLQEGKRIILAILYWESCTAVFYPSNSQCMGTIMSPSVTGEQWHLQPLLYPLCSIIFWIIGEFFPFPCSFPSSLIYSPNKFSQLQEDLGVISSLLSDTVGYQINFNCKPQDYAKSPFPRSHT